MTDYPFKMKPRAHQLHCWERSRDDEYFGLFIDMGGGKTKVIIDTLAWLYDHGKITGALIVAPKGVYANWPGPSLFHTSDTKPIANGPDDFIGEIPKHMPDHVRYRCALFDAGAKKAEREQLEQFMREVTPYLRILMVNVESLALEGSAGRHVAEQFLLGSKALMAIDESTCIKNPAAKRTKFVMKLGKAAEYRRVLCGDPYANSPLDVWSPSQFLSDDALPFGSFFTFRAAFANLVDMKTNVGGRDHTFKKVTGYRDLDKMRKLVGKYSFTIKKSECLDLPPKIYLPPRYSDMLPEQKRVYDEMHKYSVAELEARQRDMFQPGYDVTAAPSVDTSITADIVLTKLLRLQQIACGFTKTDGGEEVDLCGGKNPRIASMLDALRETGEKAIIWSHFRYSLAQIQAALLAEYGPGCVVRFDGTMTNVAELERAKRDFQDPLSDVRFFLANQQKGARGLTLTAAGLVLYYSQPFDGELRTQSEDRAHRDGLTHAVSYQDLWSRGAAVDPRVSDVLKGKRTISDILRSDGWRALF